MAFPRSSRALSVLSRTSRSILLLQVLVGVSGAMALDVQDIQIAKQGRAYEVQATFHILASVNQVMAILTDYGFPDRLDPEVTSREVIRRDGEITRVRTEIRSCVIFFCKDLALTQDVTVIADTIQADIVPTEGDFRSGYFRWMVSSSDTGGSYLIFTAVVEPDFYIPPVVGGYLARRKLRQKILATAQNLESEAAREPYPQ